MSNVTLSLGFGIVTASILALAAVGFTLQFGVTNVFNLAYGHIMTVGMFVAYAVNVTAGASIWLGLLAGAVAGAILTGLINRVVFVPFLRRRSPLTTVIFASLALGIVIQNVLLIINGPGFFAFRRVNYSYVHVLGMEFTGQQVTIVVIAVLAMVALHVLLRYTRLGKAMRATAANAGLASTCGIATERITMLAWILSGALCGAAGVTFAVNLSTFANGTGTSFLLVVVAAAVFGGVGQPYGAMLGAAIIGIATEMAALWNPALKNVMAFALLALMLLVRPNGLIPASAASTEIMTQ